MPAGYAKGHPLGNEWLGQPADFARRPAFAQASGHEQRVRVTVAAMNRWTRGEMALEHREGLGQSSGIAKINGEIVGAVVFFTGRFFRLWRLQEGAPARLQRALNGEVLELEKESIHLDGSKVWEFIRYQPAYDDNDVIIGASLSITNIQPRKTQETLLQESRDYYQAILNSTSDVYFLISAEMKLLATNSIGEESLARLVETWNLPDKQTAFETLFKKQERFDEYFHRALAGEVTEVEREVVRYDGTKVWYFHRFLPVFNDAKESIGVSISMTNIHTRKMQELEIEAKNQALTKIAWSHSHEMRRPVASILGLMQLRQAHMISEEEFMAHLATMINELDTFIKKNVEHTYLS